MSQPFHDYLSKENTTCLKGLLAIAIILAHWRNYVTFLHDTIPGMILTAAGYLGVGAFFFLSAYGMRAQGPGYLNRFPQKRILPYYVTYLIAIVLYTAANIAEGGILSGEMLLRSLAWYGTVVDYGWYLQAQLLLYLLFFLVYRKGGTSWSLLILLVLYSIACLPNKDFLWYASILCFPMGIWWNDHQKAIDRVLCRRWGQCFLVVFLLFSVTLLLGNLTLLPVWPMRGMKRISAVFFIAFVMLLLGKVPIQNPVTRFLGRISGEVYIMQGMGFRLFRGVMEAGHFWLYLLGILTVSILGGMVLHAVFAKIRQNLRDITVAR